MQTLTIDQLRTTQAAGGVKAVSIKAQGASFFIQIDTQSGDQAILVKARSTTPREFINPSKAITVLHEVGLVAGTFDTSHWDPDQKSINTRPDRSEALKSAYKAAEYQAWLLQEHEEGLKEADDPNTVWVSHEEVKDDMKRQRERLMGLIKAGKK